MCFLLFSVGDYQAVFPCYESITVCSLGVFSYETLGFPFSWLHNNLQLSYSVLFFILLYKWTYSEPHISNHSKRNWNSWSSVCPSLLYFHFACLSIRSPIRPVNGVLCASIEYFILISNTIESKMKPHNHLTKLCNVPNTITNLCPIILSVKQPCDNQNVDVWVFGAAGDGLQSFKQSAVLQVQVQTEPLLYVLFIFNNHLYSLSMWNVHPWGDFLSCKLPSCEASPPRRFQLSPVCEIVIDCRSVLGWICSRIIV